jgi:hypothetical protein
VHLDYETNYGPGGCQRGQVVQLFFDASPVAAAAMDPSRCGASRTVRVPSGSCGRHVFRAAWRTGQDPTLYGEASVAFDVLCKEPPPSPPARPRAQPTVTHRPTAVATTRSPVAVVPTAAASPVVPVVTAPAAPLAHDQDDSGSRWPLWLLLVAVAGALVVVLRRRRAS